MSSYLAIVAGLILLIAGGELLVRGASRLAFAFGVSPLVIGLTVVAFGTSAPELAVSLQSVRADAAELAIGNVIGSNIFNVLFILGAAALIAPLAVSDRVVRVEVPIMIALSAFTLLLALDGHLGVADGVLLAGFVAAYTFWLLRASHAERRREAQAAAPVGGHSSTAWSIGITVAGLALLVLGAQWLVAGAVGVATALGISKVVIGLTIVAAGTSLPEVAASIIATARGQRDMAIGNVIGSNIFNLALILGTTSIAAGGLDVPAGVLTFDFIVMVAVAIACLPIFFTGNCIARWEGALFLAYYVAYTGYLVLDATDHPLLPHFADGVLLFALPLTAVTLAVLVARAAWKRDGAGKRS